MTRRSACFLVLGFLLLGLPVALPVRAVTCALDNAPAATLLLPYFEVDPGNPNGATTLFAVGNSGPAATLAHVVLWTDAAVPTLAFDVYLTGYDVQTINLRDVFSGRLPATADAGRDPNDTISPRGELSRDDAFPSCDGFLPPAPLSAAAIDALRRAHAGQGSANDPSLCSALDYGDGISRGYVTIDAARRCSLLVPGDAGYFGPAGVASDSNTLWGDYFYVTPGTVSAAQAQNLVRLESDPVKFAGKPTFYGRYSPGTGADGREPLPTIWAARYLVGGSFNAATDLIVWRDIRRAGAPFPCSGQPPWYPLRQRDVVIFDEQENGIVAGACNIPILCPPPQPVVPAAVGRLLVGGAEFPVPFNFGWVFLDLNAADGTAASWVGTVASARTQFSIGLAGTPLDNGCAPNPGTLDPP